MTSAMNLYPQGLLQQTGAHYSCCHQIHWWQGPNSHRIHHIPLQKKNENKQRIRYNFRIQLYIKKFPELTMPRLGFWHAFTLGWIAEKNGFRSWNHWIWVRRTTGRGTACSLSRRPLPWWCPARAPAGSSPNGLGPGASLLTGGWYDPLLEEPRRRRAWGGRRGAIRGCHFHWAPSTTPRAATELLAPIQRQGGWRLSGPKTNDLETDMFNCIKPWISRLIQVQQSGFSLHTFDQGFKEDIITIYKGIYKLVAN